ncbi:MAG: DUF4153 domain-containing protein [Carnobacterium sp.]|uniref:DUF4153 domain-containing protein n=1 Tax=Carnobacterium sp. TaxID=48221 RepID=UPI003315D16B
MVKLIQKIQDKFQGIIRASRRYPLTVVFLLALAGLNAFLIQQETDTYTRYVYSFLVGIFLSAVAQQIYERFFEKRLQRILLMFGAILLTIVYYFTIGSATDYDFEMTIKTGIIFFILTIAFIWVPTIKNEITFNESYLSAFKAFFTTLLFTLVLYAGIGFILLAIDQLLFSVNYKVNLHALNLVISLFMPIFFLSYTPSFLGKKEESSLTPEEHAAKLKDIKNDVSAPKMLELLISYIIIPLTTIFTVILLVYLLQNITGDFWTNNLLEPMLVSYSITVIVVYILASNIKTKSSILFRKIFPKVLIPIVLFQTIASVLRIQETGLTYGRYYVILFGIFATIAGVLFSVLPIRKNGWVAVALMVLSLISIVPPIDAFTVSRVSQTNLLERTLEQNQMLEGNSIIPNADIPKEDKIKISQTVYYLTNMDYNEDIEWLAPYNQLLSYQFEEVFGFQPIYDENGFLNEQPLQDSYYATLDLGDSPVISIEEYDKMIIFSYYEPSVQPRIEFEVDDQRYIVYTEETDGKESLILMDESDETIMNIDLQETMEEVASTTGTENMLTIDEATVETENEQAELNLVFTSINIYENQYDAEFYLFINIK